MLTDIKKENIEYYRLRVMMYDIQKQMNSERDVFNKLLLKSELISLVNMYREGGENR